MPPYACGYRCLRSIRVERGKDAQKSRAATAWFYPTHLTAYLCFFRFASIASADKKLAAAVDSERDRISALKHKLEVAEDAARTAAKAGRAAAEGEANGRRAATELAELARKQKVMRQPCAWLRLHVGHQCGAWGMTPDIFLDNIIVKPDIGDLLATA